MKPVIAIVGRPNVGKSTLFNRLTRTRNALVADLPHLTRDRIFGEGVIMDRRFVVVDTGGMVDETGGIVDLINQQAQKAASEADAVIFLVSVRDGLTSADRVIAQRLRVLGKPVVVAVNKSEGQDADIAVAEFHSLGLGQPHAIASAHAEGVESLMEFVLAQIPSTAAPSDTSEADTGISIAIVGRPNVGKSTLVNRMLGDERVLVFDAPGTTRDSIAIPFERDRQSYTLIDTAGVRRRSRISEVIEKFSVIKTLQALERAHVVVVVMDAREPVTDQDTALLGLVLESGRAVVIAMNKWDGLDFDQKQACRDALDRKLHFLDYASVHFISALHGTEVGNLFPAIVSAYSAAFAELSASRLTRILTDALNDYPPPLGKGGRRIKLRYAHQGGRNPPQIIIHGNQVEALPDSYRRYLEGVFRETLELNGTPVRIEFRQGDNPFKGARNNLTPRQQARRKRLMRHVRRNSSRR